MLSTDDTDAPVKDWNVADICCVPLTAMMTLLGAITADPIVVAGDWSKGWVKVTSFPHPAADK
jgi:hypothetical protein